MLLDSSVSFQKYIEDCEVCCNPIEVEVRFAEGELVAFNSLNIEQ